MSKFNLGELLKESGVSESDTAQERIEYIPLDRIDPDPKNFYSLEGLDELAANIETVGLQQPLRVRPSQSPPQAAATAPPKGGAKDARYVVVSGHRRRAALMLIRDGGSDMFKGGVPCIVERGDVSREMQELRLIYANSSTRVLSSAELSRQAERVEELLYKLQAQGVSFPGRMRDHVAAAVNASKSKLARLHAIRNNLDSGLLAEFDAGRITESVAYRISQEASDIQSQLAKAPAIVRGETAEKIGQIIDKLKAPKASPIKAAAPAGLPQSAPPTAPSKRELKPAWRTGTPPDAGYYAVWARYSISPTRTWDPDYEILYWSGEYWTGRPGGAKSLDYEVYGWYPLPDKGKGGI